MSATIRIVHRTGYAYSGGVTASFNEIRMLPRSTHEQQVVHSRIDISPVPWTYTYTDYWGTTVTAFEVFERHESLNVVATSTVDVQRHNSEEPRLQWGDLSSVDVTDTHCEMLEIGDRVAPPADLAAAVANLRRIARTPRELADLVVDLVNAEVKYVFGATGVHTRASEAWEQRSGVCQDMAHLVLGALRSVGIPARYVSGYLHPTRSAPIGVPKVGESHAWVEWWAGAWIGHDPTNNIPSGERHVIVGRGRDYRDVPPFKGIVAGTAQTELSVTVEIVRLA